MRRGIRHALPFLACCPMAAAQAPLAQLDTVEVIGIAHRVERRIDDVSPSASRISRDEIEQSVVGNVRELLRYEPGVAVESSPARFGLGNIAIRGVTGNRVLLLVDGIRLPDSYRVGSFSNAARNLLEVGLLQRVEILRQPGSALYGADALGGVVAFSTIDPAELLAGAARAAVELDGSYASTADRWAGGALGAVRAESVEALLGYQRSSGRESDNRGTDERIGTARTAANPQDTGTESWLAKLVWPLGGGRVRLTFDRHAQGVKTEVLSLNPQSNRTVQLDGDDLAWRERASVDVDLARVGPLARLRALAYTQRAVTRDDTSEVRANTTAVCLSAPGTVRCRRDVRFRFAQKEDGAGVLAEADGLGRWLFGVELARIAYDESRDGTQTILDTGAVGRIVGGEPLPTRDFPLSKSERLGLFVQDEIALAERWQLVPALRFDRFTTRARIDPLFAAGNPGRPVADSREDALSPKLAVLYRPLPATTFSATLSTGFRAPPAADLNLGLSNLPAGYAVIPNPALRAEHSRGFELGVRSRHARFEFTASAFLTNYRDLIVSRAPLPCPADPQCVPGATGTFQSRNVSRARIHGFEAAARARLAGPWSVQGSWATAFGADTGRDRPLNTIEPPRLVAGVFYEAARFEAALHLTHARGKKHVDLGSGSLFAPPAFSVADLTASWQLRPRLRISAGVFNLTGRKHWLWSDLRDVLNPGATVDRYTQPGRNASVRLRASY